MDATCKVFTATIKSTSATTKAVNGSFEAVLSVPTLDRDKEVVDPGAFLPLPDHITIDVDHAMTVEKTVGSGRPFYDGAVLKFEGTYASHPLAQMVRSLVDEGHIRSMSVLYMNDRYEIDEKDGLKHLRSAELLNAGIVGIPANKDALITASKSLMAVEKVGARNSGHDMGLLQAAHDALVALGVKCADDGEGKSVATLTYDHGHPWTGAASTYTIKTSTETTPEPEAAAKAAAPTPAAVDVVLAKARALAAEADLALL